MIEPVDLLSAATAAFYETLAGSGLGKPIYHSLPVNIQPDYIHIAELTTDATEGSKWEQIETITVEIHTVVRGMDRQAMHGLMHRQRLALDQQPIAAAGVRFDSLRQLKAWSPRPIDGVTRVGIALFEVTGQPA